MKIVVEVDIKRKVQRIQNRIYSYIKDVKNKIKNQKRKKELIRKQQLKEVWISDLRKKYGTDPPPLLYDVDFIKKGFSYVVKYAKGRDINERETMGIIKRKKVRKIIEEELANVILSTRNMEIDHVNKCFIFYNAQTIHIVKPIKISYTYMTATLEIEDGTGKLYTCSFRPYSNYMPVILNICKKLL